MVGGNKRVETVPADWVDTVRRRVEAGRQFKEATAELLIIQAELLVLARNQRSRASHHSPSPTP
jgi:hypothetical protein